MCFLLCTQGHVQAIVSLVPLLVILIYVLNKCKFCLNITQNAIKATFSLKFIQKFKYICKHYTKKKHHKGGVYENQIEYYYVLMNITKKLVVIKS